MMYTVLYFLLFHNKILMALNLTHKMEYSKTFSKLLLSKDEKMVFKTNYRLMQVKRIVECSIPQYFQPSLSYHLSLRSMFCLFLSGRFTQVLLYNARLSLNA